MQVATFLLIMRERFGQNRRIQDNGNGGRMGVKTVHVVMSGAVEDVAVVMFQMIEEMVVAVGSNGSCGSD